MEHLGKILVFVGIVLVVAGLIIWFASDKFSWLGHLPGDIRIEKENVRFYFPVTTMIIVSLLITLILWIFKKLN